jgi:hypothetical protein
MEIDVTHMVEDADNMIELSGSKAEHGPDAPRITWDNAVAYGKEHPLLATDDARDAARAHFKEYGAWTEDEIAAWDEDTIQGIMCQDVAAAIREMTAGGEHNLYRGDDGKWYYYLGI